VKTEEQKQYNRNAVSKNRKKKRAIIWAAKDKPCVDCGIKYPPWVMQFDHLNDKVGKISNMVSKGSSFKTIIEEIKKCEVVCANCHADRTYRRLQ
jgi:hypothetical protein